MPLQPPPAALRGFPSRGTSGSLGTLFRMTRRRDRTGALRRSPWWFSSADLPEPGRFDLPRPRGTCYWSSHRYGAWVETFRGTRQVAEEDLEHYTVWTARPPASLRLANLRVKRAYVFGVTAEISTVADYELPQRWAAAFAKAGLDGVLGTCRHDPSSRALNVAVFGPAGPASKRVGWTVAAESSAQDRVLRTELAQLRVRVVPRPHDVPVAAPVL